jgi:butyryl-CoA dehydrogenase
MELSLANAYLLLDAMGHAVVAWLWLDQAVAASRVLADASSQAKQNFLRGKLAAARYFITWELPAKDSALAQFASMDPLCRDLDPAYL